MSYVSYVEVESMESSVSAVELFSPSFTYNWNVTENELNFKF